MGENKWKTAFRLERFFWRTVDRTSKTSCSSEPVTGNNDDVAFDSTLKTNMETFTFSKQIPNQILLVSASRIDSNLLL